MIEKERNKPLVSIVTVTFNAIDTIEETILSVINQDYPNIEYIIVDGGSTDGTLDIIKKYEKNLSKWISEKDKGLYDAMNKGLRLATGTWVSFKNSGDCFAEKDSLSKLFDEPIPSNVIFVYADCYRVTDWGWRIEKPYDLKLYKEIMPVIHPATFVRADYHKSHPFDIKYRVCADYNLIYHALEEECCFLYRPIPIVIFPTGGYSTLHWEASYWGGKDVQGKTNSKLGYLSCYLKYLYLSLHKSLRSILKRIPIVKRKWDIRMKSKYNAFPLPLNKYY